jgi:hypothetical protein
MIPAFTRPTPMPYSPGSTLARFSWKKSASTLSRPFHSVALMPMSVLVARS